MKTKSKPRRLELATGKISSTTIKKPTVKSKRTHKLIQLSEDNTVESPRMTNIIQTPLNFVSAPKKLVSTKQIQSAVSALFQYVEKSASTETILFDNETPIFLQITSMKVAKTPARILRLPVPHTLLTDSSEICLIVKDVGKPKEYDETIEHFEQLLSKNGITNIKTILPYHQFKAEYGKQFELKRNLLNLYDTFLVDSRISSYVVDLVGKIFKQKRKTPIPIKMDNPNLKSQIERSLRKTSLKLHSNSDSFIVQVAHNKMGQTEVSENVVEIIDQLSYEFPGGEDNIRAISIKTDKSIAIPIYLTLRNKNEVLVPIVHTKRPKHFHEVREELSTCLNKEVTVLPSGKVIVHNVAGSDDEGDDDAMADE